MDTSLRAGRRRNARLRRRRLEAHIGRFIHQCLQISSAVQLGSEDHLGLPPPPVGTRWLVVCGDGRMQSCMITHVVPVSRSICCSVGWRAVQGGWTIQFTSLQPCIEIARCPKSRVSSITPSIQVLQVVIDMFRDSDPGGNGKLGVWWWGWTWYWSRRSLWDGTKPNPEERELFTSWSIT